MNILEILETKNRKTWAEATDTETGEKIFAPIANLYEALTEGRFYQIRHIEPPKH